MHVCVRARVCVYMCVCVCLVSFLCCKPYAPASFVHMHTPSLSLRLQDFHTFSNASTASLFDTHARAMALLTTSQPRVFGDWTLARAVNASLYALATTVRENVTYSSSPGGLATNSYHGHTFWYDSMRRDWCVLCACVCACVCAVCVCVRVCVCVCVRVCVCVCVCM